MEAKATARTMRITPRKVRLVLDLIRGKNTVEAIVILKSVNRASPPVIEKVLMSALANAEHNYDMNIDELVIKGAYANEGPTLRRFRPRAQSHANAISKRTSHITAVVSDDKEEAKKV